jgi:hypothetical protein
MEQAFSIWSPVVMAQLNTPRRLGREQVFSSDRLFSILEDIKVKVKHSEALTQGQAVEVRIKIDILCLLEDTNGSLHLVKKEETIKERVPYAEFDHSLEKEEALNFVINIKDISSDGDLKGKEIRVKYLIEYTMIVTREQIVRLWSEQYSELGQGSLNQLFKKLEGEVARLTGENQQLHRKIFFYQRDISSLKRSIRKLEKNNADLVRETSYYQQESEGLRESLREREKHIYRLKHYPQVWSNLSPAEKSSQQEEVEVSLGRRIKRLFLNNVQ